MERTQYKKNQCTCMEWDHQYTSMKWYLHGMGSSIHQHEMGPMYYMVYGRGSSIYYNGMGPMYLHGMGPMHQLGMGPMSPAQNGKHTRAKVHVQNGVYMYMYILVWNGTNIPVGNRPIYQHEVRVNAPACHKQQQYFGGKWRDLPCQWGTLLWPPCSTLWLLQTFVACRVRYPAV